MSWLAALVAASLPCFLLVSGQILNATTANTTTPVFSSTSSGNGTTGPAPILKSYMAIGDSYSAGNGAGSLVSPDQPSCRRSSGSYVYQLLNDRRYWEFLDPAYPFEFKACSGATTSTIVSDQIKTPQFIRGADLYTMSAGGNDLNFAAILRSCVYNWPPFSCEGHLADLDTLLKTGSTFDDSLTKLYSTLSTQADGGQVIIVPYIQFYNDSVPRFSECLVSPSVRKQLNQAVTQVNAFLSSRASRFPGFSMIDDSSLQSAFDGHRFCDSGQIWIQDSFFESLSPAARAQYNSNGTLPVDVAKALNSTLTEDGQFTNGTDDDNDLANIFHPTFEGYTAYYKLVAGAISPAVAAAASNASLAPISPINTQATS